MGFKTKAREFLKMLESQAPEFTLDSVTCVR